ncbi:MAG: hypothetical protein KJ747_05420 [Actinobacteria bacterium]|nr:hypothetical protein [Actinomycetota bacterium]MCG2807318.1 hypothetical protein [Coriobacteriia bacterium]
MDIVEAIKEALPLARIRGSQESASDDGSTVVAQELDGATGFAVAILIPDGSYRPATRAELESAGFPYRSTIDTMLSGRSISCAWTPWT